MSGAAAGAVLALLLRRFPMRAVARPAVARAAQASLVLLAALTAWPLVAPWSGSLRAGKRPSVLVLSLDTLRADRLALMPRLRRVLVGGTVFTEAMATAPWTLPSHASLFTSLLPFDHKAQWTHAPVRPRRPMLAELFRDAGYRTAGFTGGAYVGDEFGFAQGFDRYEDHDEMKEGGVGRLRERPRLGAPAPGRSLLPLRPHLPAAFPLSPGAGRHRAAGPAGIGLHERGLRRVYGSELRLTPEERRYVTALYDSDVRSTDAAVGGFLEKLQAEGMLDELILVVLSDHGEDLWDHVDIRSPGHGHSLYEELIHVPLAVRAPGRVAAATRLAAPVSLLDVAPTLLDLCGLPRAPAHAGRSLAAELREGGSPKCAPSSRSPSSTAPTASRCARDRSR